MDFIVSLFNGVYSIFVVNYFGAEGFLIYGQQEPFNIFIPSFLPSLPKDMLREGKGEGEKRRKTLNSHLSHLP